jgi:hypothetical protein
LKAEYIHPEFPQKKIGDIIRGSKTGFFILVPRWFKASALCEFAFLHLLDKGLIQKSMHSDRDFETKMKNLGRV